MRKLILLFIVMMRFVSNIHGQAQRDTTLESAIGTFINYPDVAEWLKSGIKYSEDSTLYFADLDSVIKQRATKIWMGHKINFVNDELLIDSLRHFQPHFVLKGRSDFFVIITRKVSANSTNVTIVHSFNNKFVESTMIRMGKLFYVTGINISVM